MYYIILIYYINEYTILASNHIKLEYNIVGNGRVYWSLKKDGKLICLLKSRCPYGFLGSLNTNMTLFFRNFQS